MCFYGKILVHVAACVIPGQVCGAHYIHTKLHICAYVGMELCVGNPTEKVR